MSFLKEKYVTSTEKCLCKKKNVFAKRKISLQKEKYVTCVTEKTRKDEVFLWRKKEILRLTVNKHPTTNGADFTYTTCNN